MEKVIYALWRRPDHTRADLNAALLSAARGIAGMANVRALRLNLQDAAVAPAEPHRQHATAPQMDAVAQLWLDVAHGAYRRPIDAAFAALCGRVGAWLVTESAPIPNTLHPPAPGARCAGWAQFCFLLKPERLDHATWREIWQGSHTKVGVETQSNFEYIQNMVVRPLIEGHAPYAAMVEECFPEAAMTDPTVFFDAAGDPEKFKRNTEAMMASCARFIDPGGVDVLPTSQWNFAAG